MEDARLGALRRASSRTQGLRATVDEQLFAINRDSRKRASNEAPDRSRPHPHIGIGLPMSNIYATFVPWSYGRRSCLDQYHFQVLRGIVGPREHGWLRCVI